MDIEKLNWNSAVIEKFREKTSKENWDGEGGKIISKQSWDTAEWLNNRISPDRINVFNKGYIRFYYISGNDNEKCCWIDFIDNKTIVSSMGSISLEVDIKEITPDLIKSYL